MAKKKNYKEKKNKTIQKRVPSQVEVQITLDKNCSCGATSYNEFIDILSQC